MVQELHRRKQVSSSPPGEVLISWLENMRSCALLLIIIPEEDARKCPLSKRFLVNAIQLCIISCIPIAHTIMLIYKFVFMCK